MIKLVAWVLSIALVVVALRLPRPVLDVMMVLALAITIAMTIALAFV
jgi:hypothetical protein